MFKPRGSLIGAIVKPPRENNQAGLITFPDDSIKVESVRLRGSGLERQAMPVEGELKFLEHYLAEKDYYHNGIFYFFNLPEGEYELSVDARGYQKFVARYKVVPGQNYNLMNIVLQRASTRNGLYGRVAIGRWTEMKEPVSSGVDNIEIVEQIAALSRLLGMIPGDGTVVVTNQATRESMELSKWFDEARRTFFKLSVLAGKALDLNLQ